MKAEEIRKSLMHQLVLRGADVEHFEDLVNEYIRFWNISQQLDADIAKRGVMFTDVSSVGIPMMKNNPSVKEKVVVNKQMLAILTQLKITTDMVVEQCADEL